MGWMDIIKNIQVVTPTTKISQRKEPKEEEERNCCAEAAEKYENKKAELFGMSPPEPEEWLSWCKSELLTQLLKNVLDNKHNHLSPKLIELDKYGLKFAKEWKECEEW